MVVVVLLVLCLIYNCDLSFNFDGVLKKWYEEVLFL